MINTRSYVTTLGRVAQDKVMGWDGFQCDGRPFDVIVEEVRVALGLPPDAPTIRYFVNDQEASRKAWLEASWARNGYTPSDEDRARADLA